MKKKVGSYVKIADDLKEDFGFIKNKTLRLRKSLKDATPKGWVPLTAIEEREGTTSDDFMQNMFTIMVTQFIIRAPRIVSRKYHKNTYQKFGRINPRYYI